VRALRDDGAWSWVWASSNAYEWLPGRPRHDRLLAVSAEAVIVLDTITGSGARKIASRLHLHPEQPDTDTQVQALGATATPRQAPYHERFGQTTQRTRLDVESEVEIPWVGGWLIRAGNQENSPEVASDLHIQDGFVQLECSGGFEVSLRWRFSAGESGNPVDFCSPDRESAT
jgi:hypothetical protein